MKKVLLLFIFIFLFLSFSSAALDNLGVFATGSCVNIVQTCADCTFANITSIVYPNSTSAIGQVAMSQTGTRFTYNFCNNSLNGLYTVTGFGNPSNTNTVFTYTYEVNPLGRTLTSAQALIYGLMFFMALFIFIGTVVAASYIPSKNPRDAVTGYILAVENLKYLKMFLWCLAYLILMLIFYFGWIMSFGFLDLDFLGNLFNVAWVAMTYLILPLLIVGFFIIVANIIRDNKISDKLSRGFRIK